MDNVTQIAGLPARTCASCARASPVRSTCRATTTGTRHGRPGTSPSTSGPTAVVVVESRRTTSRPSIDVRPRERPARRSAGHRPRRLGARRPARHDPAQDRTACAASRSTPSAGSPAPRPARSGSRSSRRRPSTASPRSPARRRTSASSATRSAAASRWLARKHGIGANQVTAIELVTADGRLHARRPRRTSPTCSGRCAAAAAASAIVTAIEFNLFPIRAGLRRHPLVPGRARGRGPDGVARLDGRSAGRDDVGRPDPAVPADPGDPGAGSRQVVRGRRGDLRSATPSTATQLGGAAARARTRDGHGRRRSRCRSSQRLHMDPEDPAPGVGDGDDARRRRRRGDRGFVANTVGLAAPLGGDPPSRRRRRAARRPSTVRSPHFEPRT